MAPVNTEKNKWYCRRYRQRRRLLKGKEKCRQRHRHQTFLEARDVKRLERKGLNRSKVKKAVAEDIRKRAAERIKEKMVYSSDDEGPNQPPAQVLDDGADDAEVYYSGELHESQVVSDKDKNLTRTKQRELELHRDMVASLLKGDDDEDIAHLNSFIYSLQSLVSVSTLDKVTQFFYSFAEKMARLKMRKKVKKSYVHARRKALKTIPRVLTDIILDDGEHLNNQEKVLNRERIIREVNKVSLDSIRQHVYQHRRHHVDPHSVSKVCQFCNN